MHPNDFTKGIELITETYGEAPTKGPRLLRIRSLCNGRISGDGFVEICENICDSSRYPPLPKDFDTAVVEWRKAYYSKTGRYYSEDENSAAPIEIDVINCSKCNDLGLVHISYRVPGDFEALMRCGCGKLEPNEVAMPEWDPGLSGVFASKPCPVEWFKPDIAEDDTDISINHKIWERVQFWNGKKQAAEKHWASLGFK